MNMTRKRERIVPRLIEEEMREAFLDYSMSVIVQRALPDVRDGLKPVHRRILYAMSELGLLPGRPHKKSATVVGEVLGKYHPHGDSAVYDALVRMVQDFSLRYPLVAGQGNFGSVDGDPAAAYRYTEVKLSAVSLELLSDLDKETVDWAPNFDERLSEPSVLPARLPNLLVNGSAGIAVGMSTNIPPHNLREVAAAFRRLVEDPECTVADLMEHIPGPDLPTGGFVIGTEGIRRMYESGRGRITMRARIVREALRGGKAQLVVTEIPYGVSKARIIAQIVMLSRKGRIPDVTNVRDESDRDGMRLVLELKRGTGVPSLLRRLHRSTHLQVNFGAILLALDHGEPREFNLKEFLERYRDHRLEVVVRRSRHELEKAEAERHVVEGLLLALDHIDEVIELIRRSRDRATAGRHLEERFGFSPTQAEAILRMRLGQLTALDRTQLEQRRSTLERSIGELGALLASEASQLALVVEELNALTGEFGDSRRTVILTEGEEEEAPAADVVADEDFIITVSRQGFLKRVPIHLYQRRIRSGKPLAGMEKYRDDWLERVFRARSRGWVLAFTERGRAHFLSVLDTPESAPASRGQSVYALTQADRRDRIVALVPVEELGGEHRHLIFVSRHGFVKRTVIAEFRRPRAGGIIASGVREGDGILDVFLSDEWSQVLLLTRNGRAIRFEGREIPVRGRTAQGVKGIDLRDGDQVIGAILVRRDAFVLTMSASGSAKRIPLTEFPLQRRGGLGTLAIASGAETGFVGALEVVADDEVAVVTASGTVSHMDVQAVPEQGRRTVGRRVVQMPVGDQVVAMMRSIGSTGLGVAPAAPGREGDPGPPSPSDGARVGQAEIFEAE